MKKLIALLLALTMIFSMVACGAKEEAAAPAATEAAPAAKEEAPAAAELDDPYKYFTQFDEPQELHVALAVGADALATLEGDDTIEDNFFTRWLLENYNIKIVYDWTASSADGDQKLAMAISSDTLPDAWLCAPQYWKQCAKNGQLMDITQLFEEWGSETLKQVYSNAGTPLDACMYDGVLTSLTGMTIPTEGVSVAMINKDWLDQLGLEEPETLSDIYDIAVAFKEAKLAGDATIPILAPGASDYLYSTFNNSAAVNIGLDAIFAAHDSYPGYFYTDENGEVVYGTLTESTREALITLNKWYEEGLLDPETGIRTDTWAPINANECGIFFGGWWNIGFGNPASFANDPDANWQAYAVRNDEGTWSTKVPEIAAGQRFCINADASEEAAIAAMIVMSLLYDTASQGFNTETSEDIALYPLRLVVATADFVDRGYNHTLAVLDGTESSDLYKDDALYQELWQSTQYAQELIPGYVSGEPLDAQDFVISDENINWQALYSWTIGNRPYMTVEREKEVKPAISYMTESMEMYWDLLESAEKAMILSVITGEADISAFDAFVEQWYAEGGETILAEVAAEIG